MAKTTCEMTLRFVGDPCLRERSKPVGKVDAEILRVLEKMEEIMKAEAGAGLAAPQIGVNLRMLIFAYERGGKILKVINPKILARSEKTVVMNEGCFSVQDMDGPVFADVERPESVVAEWADERGCAHKKELSGFAARVIQHEVDHLDGILFIDHLSSAKREMVMRKVKKRK